MTGRKREKEKIHQKSVLIVEKVSQMHSIGEGMKMVVTVGRNVLLQQLVQDVVQVLLVLGIGKEKQPVLTLQLGWQNRKRESCTALDFLDTKHKHDKIS